MAVFSPDRVLAAKFHTPFVGMLWEHQCSYTPTVGSFPARLGYPLDFYLE